MLYEKLNKKDNDYFSLVTIPYMNYYKNMICFKNFYPLSSYMKKKINTAFFNSLSDVIDLNHSREQLTCVNLEIDNKNLKIFWKFLLNTQIKVSYFKVHH
ncbi:hypothetical protein [Mycoplasmopsis caviae]|uniref:hypothetical protein n=1 Tax=Mycoplasmopsis caviae TaxID=55603 RepID=UPI000F7F9309|nr:hypothetical protein [Mycoplasmopsis caviae]